MAIFEWDEKYNVDIEVIDGHHKKLFDILNKLYDLMMREGSDKDNEILEIIAELLDYTNFHFSEEEKMMEKIGYPEFDSHKQIHQEFISKMIEYQNKAKNGAAIFIVVEIADVGANWIKTHILTVDALYKKYIEEQGIIV